MAEICDNGIDDDCDGTTDLVPGACDQPGYDDLGSPCAAAICAADAFCCNTQWDGICAGEASAEPACAACLCGCYDNDLDGYTNCDGDCDDFNDQVNPGAIEVCNAIDDDCNGMIDDGISCTPANDLCDNATSITCGSVTAGTTINATLDAGAGTCGGYSVTSPGVWYSFVGDGNIALLSLCNSPVQDGDSKIHLYSGDCNNLICEDGDDDGCGNLFSAVSVLTTNGVEYFVLVSEFGVGEGIDFELEYECLPAIVNDECSNATAIQCGDAIDGTTVGATIDAEVFFCGTSVTSPGVWYTFNGDGSTVTVSTCNSVGVDDTKLHVYSGDCNTLTCVDGSDDDCAAFSSVTFSAEDGITYYVLVSEFGTNGNGVSFTLDMTCEGCLDMDGDSFTTCDGDCDDTEATVYPGATELCDGIDNDCNDVIDDGLPLETYYADADDDGFGDAAVSIESCSPLAGYVLDFTDCDDDNDTVYPGVTEVCDGVDNDCNGLTDDDLVFVTYYSDADGDGFGSTLLGDYCSPPAAASEIDGDCNDGNAGIYPGAIETCDGEDQDCDGQVDNDIVYTEYFQDNDGDGFGTTSMGEFCISPPFSSEVSGDCDDTDDSIYPDATEVCNGQDEDCDGEVDEELEQFTFYADTDGDGWGDDNNSISACGPLSGYVTASGDCDDSNDSIHPTASELCNDIDDDCDGEVDNNAVFSDYYEDLDGDGFGDILIGNFCSPPANSSTMSGDCDDDNSAINPGASEVCNDIDDDCDLEVDEDMEFVAYYSDVDGDGYGDLEVGVFCTAPANASALGGDCDDTDASINPGASEFCNEIDEDCDGIVDNDIVFSDYYTDADGDGYGSTFIGNFCLPQTGSVTNSSDCNDASATTYPNAIEFCNNADDDCDGLVDEGLTASPYYADADGDGYGGALLGSFCSAPANSSTSTGDCDDSNASVNPDATEICNDIDDDCDGETDEGVMITFYEDADSDGYGSMTEMVMACTLPAGYVTSNTDCDDALATVNPNATEYCNSIDDNCNGLVDDDCIDSVEENAGGWEVQLYPNPVKEQLYITVVGATGAVNYTIYDAVGKIVFSAKLNAASTLNAIDCAALSQGSYTLMLNNNETQVHKKFIKL